MGSYERGDVRIHFEEAGSGFPLLVIAGGGLNSTISGLSGSSSPFNPMEEFKAEHHCIAVGPAQCQGRRILRPARSRPPLGRLHR